VSTPERRIVTNRAAFLEEKAPAWAPLLGVAGVLILWQLVAQSGTVPPVFLPAPTAVAAEAWRMVRSGELLAHLAVSAGRMLSGLVVGAGAGIGLGLLMGTSRLAEAVANPVLTGLYPVPKIALLPLLLLWFGTGEVAKIAVIALGAFFPACWNTLAGIRAVDPQLIRAAVSFGCRGPRLLHRVILPAALPMIFAGVRLAAGTSLLLLVPAEMIAADRGIGFLILHASSLMLTTQLMVGILTVSAMGMTLTAVINRLER
jgi:NitT/TauT family transport system permease protein